MSERKPIRIFELLEMRSRIDLINQSVIDFLETDCANYTTSALAQIKDDPKLLQSLARIKENLQADPNTSLGPPTKISICRLYVDIKYIEPIKLSASELRISNRPNAQEFFAGKFDFWLGAMATLDNLRQALLEETPSEFDKRMKSIEKRTSETFGPSTPAESEDLVEVSKNIVSGSHEMIKHDPTGFSLLDEAVMQYRAGGRNTYTFQNKELIILGALLANKTYKATYRRAINI